jgi:hypothetical protein
VELRLDHLAALALDPPVQRPVVAHMPPIMAGARE